MRLKLVDGEQVIVRTRAHYRALLPAAVTLLSTVAVMSFLLAYISRGDQAAFIQHYQHLGAMMIWVFGLLSLVFGVLKPALIWANRFTFLTNERVVQKNMVGSPQATVVPLALLSQAEFRASSLQQVSGAGDVTLVHGAYGRQQRTILKDMPDAESLNRLIAEQLGDYRRRAAAHQVYAVPAQQQPMAPPMQRGGPVGW